MWRRKTPEGGREKGRGREGVFELERKKTRRDEIDLSSSLASLSLFEDV